MGRWSLVEMAMTNALLGRRSWHRNSCLCLGLWLVTAIMSAEERPPIKATNTSSIGASYDRQSIGREWSVPRHLQDDEEFHLSTAELLRYGKLLFDANWTEQEGGGRPLSKGTGKQITDTSAPLTGRRSFNRISGPDANSCTGCHNAPYGISGGGGDF